MSEPAMHMIWKRACSDAACVEVAESGDTVFVRNSNQPDQTVAFSRAEWEMFKEGVRQGRV